MIFTKLYFFKLIKVRKRAKIRNRYNQAPHLTQYTNGIVTTSQIDITDEGQDVSPFPAGDLKAYNKQDRKKNRNDPTKKNRLITVSKIILPGGGGGGGGGGEGL